jgi:hypothetical protein
VALGHPARGAGLVGGPRCVRMASVASARASRERARGAEPAHGGGGH